MPTVIFCLHKISKAAIISLDNIKFHLKWYRMLSIHHITFHLDQLKELHERMNPTSFAFWLITLWPSAKKRVSEKDIKWLRSMIPLSTANMVTFGLSTMIHIYIQIFCHARPLGSWTNTTGRINPCFSKGYKMWGTMLILVQMWGTMFILVQMWGTMSILVPCLLLHYKR